jgi:homoserine kinase type II
MIHGQSFEAIRHYDLGPVLSAERLTGGFANENYHIWTPAGSFLYRIFHQQGIKEIEFELRVLASLRQHDFPTAYPVPGEDGEYCFSTDNGFVVIYEYKKGEHPRPAEYSAKEVARVLGLLHLHPFPADLAKKNAVHIDECLVLMNIFDTVPCSYPLIFDYFTAQSLYLQPYLRQSIPSGVVHGDAFPENVIFQGKELLALVDFEESCIDHRLFDVGVGMNGFCFPRNMADIPLIRIFLKAYESYRKLTPEEKELLPYYIQWGAHGMILWHLKHLVKRRNKTQEARVYELMNRVNGIKKLIDLGGLKF